MTYNKTNKMTEMTTYRLRHKLPDGVRHRFVTNIRHNGTLHHKYSSLYRAIDDAMIWSKTPEGEPFWNTVQRRIGINVKLPPMPTDMSPDEYLSLINRN